MSSLIEAIEVRRSFPMGARTIDVLRGVSLAVTEGESLAISGMSGAGKSTLLHVMGGLDRPTAGRVLYRGRDLYAAGDRERSAIRARKIGFVFQAYHLLPELTVLENVLLPGLSAHGAFLRGGALRERSAMLLDRVGLSARALHRPNELSGGEQQRAAIARALMNAPELLLADEPTGNLDSKTGEEVLHYLFELAAEQGLTLVMVTHNEAVAARCRRHVELRDGRPVA
ncbi:MAG TPA: ABC transporter ATP-binding protein [Kiritimatiellia bacterium]|nr:ABC transporter ATP-binding protein [Kiritimatiellia bacterium]